MQIMVTVTDTTTHQIVGYAVYDTDVSDLVAIDDLSTPLFETEAEAKHYLENINSVV